MISLRLATAAEFLKGFYCLADCGTDHAYLPMYAIEKHYVKQAIASDNKSMPLKNAADNIRNAGLSDRITLKMADGLPYLDATVDIVSILGMGGRLVKDILERADLTYVKRLVLSPNSEQNILREWLLENRWKIVDEAFVKDRQNYYQIIVCERGLMRLEPLEKEFGPFIIKQRSPEFQEFIQKLINQLETAVPDIQSGSVRSATINRIQRLKEMIQP